MPDKRSLSDIERKVVAGEPGLKRRVTRKVMTSAERRDLRRVATVVSHIRTADASEKIARSTEAISKQTKYIARNTALVAAVTFITIFDDGVSEFVAVVWEYVKYVLRGMLGI